MSAWVLLEATAFLVRQYGWPEWIIPVLTVVLAFGLLSAATAAWFHGAAGDQRLCVTEVAAHSVIFASLLAVLWLGMPLGAGSVEEDVEPPPVTRVAVLYYKDHTAAKELISLASDLTEAVVHRLNQVPALDVSPLTAVEPYRDAPVPYDSLVAALGAGSLVEGSLTRSDRRVVVTTQLIETRDQADRGSWVYRRPDTAWSAALDEVADSVAADVRSAIGRQVTERRVRASTDAPEALALYRRGQAILENEASTSWREDRLRGLRLLTEADSLLAEAERLDPGWIEPTLLRIRAAESRAQLVGGAGSMDRSVLATAIEHLDRALALATDSAPLLERRGHLRFIMAEHSEAEEANRYYASAEADLRAASRLDPEIPATWWGLSRLMGRQGNLEGAYVYARKAYETDSFLQFTSEVLSGLVRSALDLRRIDEATAWCLEGRRLLPSDQSFVMWRLVLLASLPEIAPEDVETAWAYVDTLVATGMPERRSSWQGYGEMLVAVTLA
ncbi:MAG: hypothetical protein P8177_11380, partial [Gemmatimonadota bacterium]